MKDIIAKIIKDSIKRKFNIDLKIGEIVDILEIPPDENFGNYAFPCFSLSKILKENPNKIAETLRNSIDDLKIQEVKSEKGYLNIFIKNKEFVKQAFLMKDYAFNRKGKTVVMDYSHPNIAKPFTLAHLRSTVIGNALKNIYTFAGYDVVAENYLGDWGTQFGKLIYAFLKWGDEEKLKKDPIIHLLNLYVRFHKEAEKDKSIEDEGRRWFAKLEKENDKTARELWSRFREISLEEFKRLYKRMNIEFTTYTGESFYKDQWKIIISLLKNKGLLKKSENAYIVDLKDYDMPPCLILKSDGSTLYATRDIAAAIYREKKYGFQKCIYVVDSRQSLHFKQFFKVISLLGYEWAKGLVHDSFGMLKFEEGIMSTRKGKVILLEDVFDKAKKHMQDIINEKNPELKDKENIADIIGINAVMFNDLKHDRVKDILFKWDEAFNIEGETGPYLNYTYVRIQSIIKKAEKNNDANISLLREKEEISLCKQIMLFPETIIQVINQDKPHILARFLIELAQSFNTYYQQVKIIQDDKQLQDARIALLQLVAHILKKGMGLLGMRVVNEM